MNDVSSSWPALAGLSWQVWAAIGVGLVVVLALWRMLRGAPDAAGIYDARNDRYASLSPINRDEIEMLHYLQQSFPDGAVLFRPRLAQVLTVRKSADRQRAMVNLGQLRVDYLVCSMDGEACYAFDLDRAREQNDEDAQLAATQQKLMLRTAGIRLVRLRGSARRMPPAAELRERVTRDAPKPVVAGPSGFSPSAIGASGFEPSEQSLSSFGATGGDTGFGNSGFSNSGFAASKPPSANEPWDAVRKRS